MLAAVKLLQSVNQPKYTRMHHVFEQDMPRQALVNAARNVTHLRQLFHQHPLALTIVLPAVVRTIARGGHKNSARNRAWGGAFETEGSSSSDM